MKLSHFLRFYRNIKGVTLAPEEAEEEASRLGITIDRSGEGKAESSLRSEKFIEHVA
jgi:hypothetical protein